MAPESTTNAVAGSAEEGAVVAVGAPAALAIVVAMEGNEEVESSSGSPSSQHQPPAKRARVSETGGDDEQDLSASSDMEIDLQPLQDEEVFKEQQHLFSILQRLFQTHELPDSLKQQKGDNETWSAERATTLQNLENLRELLEYHGLRTSLLLSPRPAVSVYKDSCLLAASSSGEKQKNHDNAEKGIAAGKEFLITMLGLHPSQSTLEQLYAATVRPAYCLACFCRTVRKECAQVVALSEDLRKLLSENESVFHRLGALIKVERKDYEQNGNEGMNRIEKLGSEDKVSGSDESNSNMETKRSSSSNRSTFLRRASFLSSTVNERVASIAQCIVSVDPGLRVEQLQHEYERISFRNSTVTNAHLQLFLEEYKDFIIQEMYFKRCPTTKQFERIAIYLHDPQKDPDARKPDTFTLLPAISTLLKRGPEQVATDMVHVVWKNLLRQGYYITRDLKEQLSQPLHAYFLSGLANDVTIPLPLCTHFTPSYPLSFYLEGNAGSGKSSLARNLVPAMNGAIEEFADPEILVRFVQLNLNKPYDALQMELELRPNNNDLSVMSIVQGRRVTMTQTKPGLVILIMEEMPPSGAQQNPNQEQICQLLSQRFAGRRGEFKEKEVTAPRNSAKRGISTDASIIPIFISNCPLAENSRKALQKLELFSNLNCIQVSAISGQDRNDFAYAYLRQFVQDQLSGSTSGSDTASNSGASVGSPCSTKVIGRIDLDIPLGSGDLRPLVTHLRILAFYVCVALANGSESSDSEHEAFSSVAATRKLISREGLHLKIVQRSAHCNVSVETQSIDLKVGSMQNIFPVSPQIFDRRTDSAIEGLRGFMGGASLNFSELSIILDFWLSKTLAPTVLVSVDANKIRSIIAGLGALEDVQCICNINAGEYKMTRSLYDDSTISNLRDTIRRLGRGAFVAVELICETVDAQLCIRELIEGTPSLTPFSSDGSALYKAGLLFGIYVKGKVTPELLSRASFVV